MLFVLQCSLSSQFCFVMHIEVAFVGCGGFLHRPAVSPRVLLLNRRVWSHHVAVSGVVGTRIFLVSLLQFSEFGPMYSIEVSSSVFVSMLGESVAFSRSMYVADVSISPLVISPNNSRCCGPLMIWWMSIH